MKKYIVVVIDPGHGGSDPGAVGPSGLYESHVAWRIACIVADILMRYNVQIIFTRVGDTKVSLEKRVQIANKSGADYFVSIHINSANNPKASGTEVYAYSKASEGNILADRILNNLVSTINLPNRGVKYDRMQVVSTTKMPAALVEVAFLNNPVEEALIKTDEFQERAAVGIAKGILEHVGINYMPIPKEVVELSEEEETKQWQIQQGLEHLENLIKKGFIQTPEFWSGKMLENVPVWSFLSLVDRITDK